MRLTILWLALAAAGAWLGSRRLDAEVDVLALLPQSSPEVRGMKLMREHFQEENELLIVIEAVSGSDAGEAAEMLLADQKLASLAKEIRMLSGEMDAGRGGALLAWAWQNAPPEKVAALVQKLTGSSLRPHLDLVMEKLATTPDPAEMQRLSYDPLGLLDVLDADDVSGLMMPEPAAYSDQMRIIAVQPRDGITSYKQAMPWLDAVRDRAASVSETLKASGKTASIRFTGEIAFMAETGGGMERDLSATIGGSMGLIAMLFWVMYRRLMPLVFIVLLLAAVLGITVGIGAILLGGINAMNLGFAAIVLGLAVDYGVLIYQESAGAKSPAEIRGHAGRSIIGGAATTAAVFLLLSLSSFPGLRQIGILVAIGVAVGAAIMLISFPHIAMRFPFSPRTRASSTGASGMRSRWAGTALLLLASAVILAWKGMPGFDASSSPLRPRNSEAMRALEKVEQADIAVENRKSPLLVSAKTLPELKTSIAREPSGWLPAALLPDAEAQTASKSALESLIDAGPRLLHGLDEAGFTPDSTALFSAFLQHLGEALKQPWPMEFAASSAFPSLRPFISHKPDGWAVLGWTQHDVERKKTLAENSHIPSWTSLGQAMGRIARNDAMTRMLPLAAVILTVLFAVFRSWREVVLTAAALAAGFFVWFAMMSLAGQSWNLMSIAALPLLIGTAEDYSIHMLMAMQRTGGDIALARATTGRAVLFCGLSSMIGFGSLAFASNGGLASLGIACALGIAATLLVALRLLPRWAARPVQDG